MIQKKSAQKVGKKCVFRRLGGRFCDYVGLAAGDLAGYAALLRRQEPQLSRRTVPYERNLTQKNYLQRVSAESECRE